MGIKGISHIHASILLEWMGFLTWALFRLDTSWLSKLPWELEHVNILVAVSLAPVAKLQKSLQTFPSTPRGLKCLAVQQYSRTLWMCIGLKLTVCNIWLKTLSHQGWDVPKAVSINALRLAATRAKFLTNVFQRDPALPRVWRYHGIISWPQATLIYISE